MCEGSLEHSDVDPFLKRSGGSMESKNKQDMVATLESIATSISSVSTASELAITIEAIVDDLVSVQYSGIYFFDPQESRLRLLFAKGFNEEERAEAEHTAMDRHPGQVFLTGQMLHVPDTELEPDRSISSVRSFSVRSRIYLPVVVNGECVGCLGLGASTPNAFSEEHVHVLRFVGNLAGSVYRGILSTGTLKEQTARLELVLDSAELGSWDWNVESGEVVFNERWVRMLGYELSEIRPHVDSWSELLHPDDAAAVGAALNDHLEGRTAIYKTEHRLRSKSGAWRWVLDCGKVIVRDQRGLPLRATGIHQDITERKQMEAGIAESEKNFRTFFETLDDMIVIGDDSGKVFYTNPAVTRKLGYTPEELNRMCVLDLHPAERRQEAEHIFAEMLTGKRYTCRVPLGTKEGQMVPVETRAWPSEWDGKDCIFRFSRDLSKEQEALQKFNKLFMSNPALTGVSTVSDGRFTEVNRAFLDILGYERSEVIGETAQDLGLFAEPEKQAKFADRLRNDGSSREIELKVRTKSGFPLDVLLSGEIITSQNEQLLMTVMTDITQRKLAEHLLRENEQDLVAVLSSIDDLVFTIDARGYFKHHIKRVGHTYPYDSPDRLAGKHYTAVLPPDVATKFRTAFDCIAETGQAQAFEYMQEVGSKRKWFSARATARIEKDGTIGTTTVVRDITTLHDSVIEVQRHAEFEDLLSRSSAELVNAGDDDLDRTIESILANVGAWFTVDRVYVFHLSDDSKTMSNTHEWRAQGVDPEVENLQNIPTGSFPTWIATLRAGDEVSIEEVRKLPLSWKAEQEILEQQGIQSVLAVPMMLQGSLCGFVGFDSVRSKTQWAPEYVRMLRVLAASIGGVINRARQHAALTEAMVQAESANRAKSAFLASMSHEIRTPLHAIIGMTELLRQHELTAEQTAYSDIVLRNSEGLLYILNDILDFSKIEAGHVDLQRMDFDVLVTIESVGELLAHKSSEKNIELSWTIDPTVPTRAIGDAGRLRQILVNLIGNAVKFTKEGSVRIHVSLDEEDDNGATVRFAVTDTGMGIKREHMRSLFDRFEQGMSSYARTVGGTGLGLAISKRLVEKMGGEIGVESEQGLGSTFWFTAKFEKQQLVPAVEETRTLESVEATVLVVDDNDTIRKHLEALIGSFGLVCHTAPDANSALEMLAESQSRGTPYRIAVLDMLMPNMSGEELGKRIVEDPSLEGTSLVMLTSYGSRGDAERLRQAGFSAYLNKPIMRDVLYDCLATVLDPPEDGKLITTFTIAEARRREAGEFRLREGTDQYPASGATDRKRILVVEDNPDNQLFVRRLLESAGFDVSIAQSGARGIAMARESAYDLIFMDIEMPGLDGFDCASGIRKFEAEHEMQPTPIVALTAHAVAGYRERGLDVGMSDFLTKPIGAKILIDAARSWILGLPTALVVDDSVDSRLLLERVLRGSGMLRVICVNSAIQALKVVESTKVDIIYLAYELPDMDGPELARNLKKMKNLAAVPIVAISGRDDPQSKHALEQAGCAETLTKPVRQEELLRSVHTLLPVSPGRPRTALGFNALADPNGPVAEETVVCVDEEIVDLVPGFIENRRKDLRLIREHLISSDIEKIRRIGHNWKGAGRSYGFVKISELGKEIEDAASAGDVQRLADLLEETQSHLDRLRVEIRKAH